MNSKLMRPYEKATLSGVVSRTAAHVTTPLRGSDVGFDRINPHARSTTCHGVERKRFLPEAAECAYTLIMSLFSIGYFHTIARPQSELLVCLCPEVCLKSLLFFKFLNIFRSPTCVVTSLNMRTYQNCLTIEIYH